MNRISPAAKWLSGAGLLLFSLLIAELSLRVLGLAIPQVYVLTGPKKSTEMLVPHPVLGYAGNPDFPEHDERGFRNTTALRQAHVVTLGDSQTYGTSARTDHAWPAVLGRLSKTPVYNMGLGTYGAAHSAENIATALELDPELVVFALYFGNDFYDDFRFALANGLLSTLISIEAVNEVTALENKKTLAEEIDFLFARTSGNGDSELSAESSGLPILTWLAEHLRLFGLLRAIKVELETRNDITLLDRDFEKAVTSLTDRQATFVSVFDDGEWKTILAAPYRYRVLDDSDPRVRAGIEVTKDALRRMRDRVVEAGADYVVLLVPTKEYVFWPRVETPRDHAMLEELSAIEKRLHEELGVFLDSEKIPFVDLATALRRSVEQPYFSNADGHPNRLGHEIIAREVLRQLAPTTR
jgi:lysophospholipase L1-like esterase